MAAVTWPAALPDDVLAGYSEGTGGAVLRSSMDAGPAKVRRRFTAVARPIDVTIELTRAEVQVFLDWFDGTLAAGALDFDWVHPRTRTAAEFRFRETDVQFRHAVGELWRADLKLEILP